MTRNQPRSSIPTPTVDGLRLAAFRRVEGILGPGQRAVLWVQGCSIRCRGCLVPETWDVRGGELVDPGTLAQELLTDPALRGLTVSGGEPTEQAGAVTVLLEAFKSAGRDTLLFSGHTLEALLARNDPVIDRLLAAVDVLVDGPFDPTRAPANGLRGSSNQRILRLTDAIPSADLSAGPPRVSLSLEETGGLELIGIPPPDFLSRLKAGLRDRGVLMR